MTTKERFGTWPWYTVECIRDVVELLRYGRPLTAYRANPKVGVGPAEGSWAWRLEREIEERFKVKHAVATNSGTAALHAALAALDVRGTEVVTSPFTFSATTAAILHAGGIPVFADVDPDTFCLTTETVNSVITKKTKAILPVHLFGYFEDLVGLHGYGLPVVEDACQAVGAIRGTLYAGTSGLAGAMSFNGQKNIPAGEGGALVTNSDEIAEKARLLVNHAENFGTKWVGYNYRMSELHACIAYHGLIHLKERNAARRRLVDALPMEIEGKRGHLLIAPGHRTRNNRGECAAHVYYVTPMLLKRGDRKEFITRMAAKGVDVGGGYIVPPLHLYPAFTKYQRCPLPVVEELSGRTMCLLFCVRPPATEEDMKYVAKSIEEALA